MTYVVTENCIKCKYTECVEVCPVDCFYEGPNFLIINPDECIDCALCEPECPAEAIWSDYELPSGQEQYLEINEQYAWDDKWDSIIWWKDALPGADSQNGAPKSPQDITTWSDYPGEPGRKEIPVAT